MLHRNKEVDEYIVAAEDSQKAILSTLRSLIFETFEQIKESYKWKRPVYGLSKDFCYLVTTKSGVNLGFYDATNINDPNQILEGTGKKMRHVKVKHVDALPKEVLKQMLLEAAKI